MFQPVLHWVRDIEPHRLALMARPRGGDWLEEEVQPWRAAGVAMVVSLLETHEIRELELAKEPALCKAAGIGFESSPIPDRGTPPSIADISALARRVVSSLHAREAVAIHCRAGIGRTGLVSACVLHHLGVPFDKIFIVLSRARGLAVPDTPAQIEWVRRFARAKPAASSSSID